ncbi:hypothetical protein Taro_027720 [Colocasia esculenta]|uniref:DCD domain-containing protein n=1 Tax=Colocasia esculenta TaxID=4460 RepID=A0A843VGH6_COLES|nr:hypothetical protein [Colocasia esculenta]
MTGAQTTTKSEGADEELMVFKVAVSDSALVEASAPVVPSGISLKEASDTDSNAESSVTVLVKVTEEASTLIHREMAGDKVVVTDEQDKEGMFEKEEGRKETTIKQEKGNTLSTDEQKRLETEKKVAANDNYVEPSSTVLVKVGEQASTVMVVEDRAGEEDSNEQGVQGEAVDERPKNGALGIPASKTRKRKKVALSYVGTSAAARKRNEDKTSVAHQVEDALSKEEQDKKAVLNEEDNANQEMKITGLTIPTASIAVAVETANDDSIKEKRADRDKVDKSLNKKNKKRKKRNKAQVTVAEAAGTAQVGADKKLSVEKEHAGMIFMCSAETKEDCYRYKVFGMPAGKKETVAKIYKGMKLFLYDIDLKLLYGIYIATGKGGYNIQSKAFNSAFPSQVRFKVLKDYLPLPEEKFKAAIKANYYKKKFRLELSAEQVKQLSKLFVEATKASKRANGRATSKRVPQDYTSRDTGRKRFKGMVSRPLVEEDVRIFPGSVATHEMEREDYASRVPRWAPFPPHGGAGLPGQAPLHLYSSPPRHTALPSLPPPAYVYERDANYYRREVPMEAYGYGAEVQLPPPDHRVPHNNPYYYHFHGEPAQYHDTRDAVSLPWGGYRDPAAPPPYRY